MAVTAVDVAGNVQQDLSLVTAQAIDNIPSMRVSNIQDYSEDQLNSLLVTVNSVQQQRKPNRKRLSSRSKH